MPPPTTADSLQQFISAADWMRSRLVDFARISLPLEERLDKELTGTRRTERVTRNILTELSHEELGSLENVKMLLQNPATLAPPDSCGTVCMYSDASDEGWSIILAQVTEWSLSLPVDELDHTLLHCMSGTFHGASKNWGVIEIESYLSFERANQWVDVLSLVQAVPNQTPVQSLANLLPIEVVIGMNRPSPLRNIVTADSEGGQVHHFDEMSDNIVTHVNKL
ncbi:hypothetical protein L915_16244 [Phytophthora nicotianae]|uniref:Uncharacterized protein n=1 Tax=Phytophthora nicotianae TaxID=4792 RepID=W2G3D6_PHYNI|nr:hypothetical protein L915_16244 [Phytophthora nicotianae]